MQLAKPRQACSTLLGIEPEEGYGIGFWSRRTRVQISASPLWTTISSIQV